MFAYLEKVLSEKGHAVVCVAEGAGQVGFCCCLAGRPLLGIVLGRGDTCC